MILGLQDGWVAAAYLLSIAAMFLCLGYGLANWNKGDEPPKEEDRQWAKEEKEAVESSM